MSITARIIDDNPHSAAFNMAADLHLLSACEKAHAILIRLYSWEKPSITLGTMEKSAETLDMAALKRLGDEWIRRATGGRSVLHDRDITYSCIFSNGAHGMGATLMETYRVVSDCLMRGLGYAGVACARHDSPPGSALSRGGVKLPCFLSPNRHEIMVSGKKLVGSAQKRTAKAVLQHGSIPLTPAFRKLPDYLLIDGKEREIQKRLLLQKCTCISEIAPEINEKELRECLIKGFRETLPCKAELSSWSNDELKTIEEIAHSNDFLRRWQWDGL
jgi:lipoyl(octanoyl) transferase